MFIDLSQQPEKEMFPGGRVRFVHSGHMTLAYWSFEAGAVLPLHQHPHEQVTSIVSGELELNVGGEVRACPAGSVIVIAGGIPHQARAISACQAIDAFYPERSEYK
jgi:quercetin dioxygenase-like cupin family protein